MSEAKQKIGILGAGAFGTAIALTYRKYFDVTLFSHFDEHVQSMKATRRNEFLDDCKLPEDIKICSTKELNSNKFESFFWVFPIKPTVEMVNTFKSELDGSDVIVCSKGILPNLTFICDFFQNALPHSTIGYLGGPNFANELALEKLSVADIATTTIGSAQKFAKKFSTPNFKLYPTDDLIGAQLSGAIKNIAAIACGISCGLGLGENAHAAIVSRSLDEMKNLGRAIGAKEETFYGFCGLGDLVLTTSSLRSRNMSLGVAIACGKSVASITEGTTCEGCDSVSQIMELASKHAVDMPVCKKVYQILCEKQHPESITDVFQ